MEEQILYMKDNLGVLRLWGIHYDEDEGDIVIRHGQVGGLMQQQTEFVPYGKAARSLSLIHRDMRRLRP